MARYVEQGGGEGSGGHRGASHGGGGDWLVSTIGGGLLTVWGLRRGGLTGLIGAAAGAWLVARGVTGRPLPELLGASPAEREMAARHGWRSAAVAERSVSIARPREALYRFWRDFTNLARFLAHVERIDVLDETRAHWVVKAPAGQTVEWDAVITEDRPNERIAWESVEGADVRNAGWVEFRESDGGTELRAMIAYEPPAGQLGRVIARLFREEPTVQARDDLDRLKRMIESGEIVV